jgi:uncharacterized protein YbbC (DUF1343 family)
MQKIKVKNTYLVFLFLVLMNFISCGNKKRSLAKKETSNKITKISPAANQTDLYLPLLEGKNIAVVANQTSIIEHKNGYTHLVDSLLKHQIKIKTVFSPEHGFRGKADAGEHVANGIDKKTDLPLISLYGKNKKPSAEQLKDIDIVLFDIQDVGVRFYTYISTLHYVMEACAEQGIKIIVLDRPNPNGYYIDGPVLEKAHTSFVGMHSVPIVYGMTIGEYAQMIQGESWLNTIKKCDLTVIPLKHYTHKSRYKLPIKPSPNLPNAKSINLYPSLCLFEGAQVSSGRGTTKQFQIFGAPFLAKEKYPFSFTPMPNDGAKYPKFKAKKCNGLDLRKTAYLTEIKLDYLINAYNDSPNKADFFNKFFTRLAGTEKLQAQIIAGKSATAIKTTWQDDLNAFKLIRSKYLLYK